MPDHLADPRGERVSTVVFWTAAVVAVPLLMYVGRDAWFFVDDWDFLAQRRASSPSDVLEPHNGHWTSLPILEWRLLYRMFGLQYEPYQLMVVLSHIAVTAALRQVMIRSGSTWLVSTTLALAFLFLGSGWQNILVPFQTTFNGSLFFGLVHLLLANTDEPTTRRDALGLAAGAAGLMCSAISLVMVLAVGAAVLISRGWRAAVLHTGPLAVLYTGWWLSFGRDADDTRRASVGDIARSTEQGFTNLFDEIASPGLGLVLLVATLGGLGYAWARRSSDADRYRLAGPTALLLTGLALFVAVSYTRAGSRGVDFVAAQGRYVHAGAVLVLPAVAVAITTFWSRTWVLGAASLLVVVGGVPGNVNDLSGHQRGLRPGTVRALADVPFVAELAPESTVFGNKLTVGFVMGAVADGRFPSTEITAEDRAIAEFVLALRQTDGPLPSVPCPRLREPMIVSLDPGESISLRTGQVVAREVSDAHDHRQTFRALAGPRLVAVGRPVTFELSSSRADAPARVCPPGSAPT